MNYEILFFATSVQALIEKWPVGIYASFVRIAEQMVVSGPNLGMPYTRAMGDGLYEIGRVVLRALVGRSFAASRGVAWSSCMVL